MHWHLLCSAFFCVHVGPCDSHGNLMQAVVRFRKYFHMISVRQATFDMTNITQGFATSYPAYCSYV